MTSINVARAALRGPSPSSTSAATTAPSTAHTSAGTSSARTDRPRPLDDLDDRVGPLLQNPPLYLAQRRLTRAGDVALVPRDQLLAHLALGVVADEQIHQHVDGRLGAATTTRQPGNPLAQLLRLERADVFDGLDDQIVKGREVVGRRRQAADRPGVPRRGDAQRRTRLRTAARRRRSPVRTSCVRPWVSPLPSRLACCQPHDVEMALSAKAKPLHRKSARQPIWMHCPSAGRVCANMQWHDGPHARAPRQSAPRQAIEPPGAKRALPMGVSGPMRRPSSRRSDPARPAVGWDRAWGSSR